MANRRLLCPDRLDLLSEARCSADQCHLSVWMVAMVAMVGLVERVLEGREVLSVLGWSERAVDALWVRCNAI